MKERFLTHGAENFNDIELLELLLFFAIPRGDTNALAHALLDRFGSFLGVMEATTDQLSSVPGIGEHAAVLLRLIPAASRRFVCRKTPDDVSLLTPTDLGRYIIPYYMFETDEVIYAILLDARDHPIACYELARGVVNAAAFSPRKLAEEVLRRKASAVVLAHNHPSGIPMPSKEDEHATAHVSDALALLGVELRDHIIVAGYEYVSMREIGLLR